MQSVALIFDDVSIEYLKSGSAPRTAMSHDFNLFQFGYYAEQFGAVVYFGSTSDFRAGRPFRRMRSIYPFIQIDTDDELDLLKADVLLSCHIQVFAMSGAYPGKKVAIHPALYFVEMPYLYDSRQTREQLLGARHHADYIIVQNERMKELLVALYGWLADWRDASRILVAPMGLIQSEQRSVADREAARISLGLEMGQSFVVNGGGIWRWTGFNDFLRGYIKAVREGAENVCLCLTGFKQSENSDHSDYINETKKILSDNSDLVGNRFTDPKKCISIHVEDDWRAASARLPVFYAAADFGLNVNGSGLENWQAQRVRCLDYIRYGVPLLTTGGDYFSEMVAKSAALKLPSLQVKDVSKVIKKISATPQVALRLRAEAVNVRTELEAKPAMRDSVETILNGSIRSKDSRRGGILDAVWTNELPHRSEASARRIANLFGL